MAMLVTDVDDKVYLALAGKYEAGDYYQHIPLDSLSSFITLTTESKILQCILETKDKNLKVFIRETPESEKIKILSITIMKKDVKWNTWVTQFDVWGT